MQSLGRQSGREGGSRVGEGKKEMDLLKAVELVRSEQSGAGLSDFLLSPEVSCLTKNTMLICLFLV